MRDGGGPADSRPFRVGISHDLHSPTRESSWGTMGLTGLTAAGVDYEFLPPDDGVLTATLVDGFDAVLFAAPAITADTFTGAHPPRHLARFGVGFDNVDVAACTASGCVLTITPDGARRPVATAALTLTLAVLHRVVEQHLAAVAGQWSRRLELMGRGLTGRTVGTLGLGNVATELFTLLAPFDTHHLAHDPFSPPDRAAALGVELVGLDNLLRRSDVLVVTAALTDDTRGLLDAERLALMAPHAVLVNVARGGIVDTDALTSALMDRRLGGAGLDVTEPEPLPPDHPLRTLPNVVLAQHCLAWTDEMAIGNGSSAVRAILDVRAGREPAHAVNPGAAASAVPGGRGSTWARRRS